LQGVHWDNLMKGGDNLSGNQSWITSPTSMPKTSILRKKRKSRKKEKGLELVLAGSRGEGTLSSGDGGTKKKKKKKTKKKSSS